jgi:hypothetical protein
MWALFLCACQPDQDRQGTDSGNPVGLTAEGTQLRRSTHGTVASASVGLKEIRLDLCDEQESTALEGPFHANLLSRTNLGTIDIADGQVCGIRMDIVKLDDGALEDTSILLEGQTTAGTPYTIQSERNESFRVESESPLSVLSGELVLFFDLEAWVRGLDIDGGQATDGTVIIDKDNNDDLLDAFEDNVDESADLLE